MNTEVDEARRDQEARGVENFVSALSLELANHGFLAKRFDESARLLRVAGERAVDRFAYAKAEQLYERAEAGLDVRGVFETTGATSRYSYYNELVDSGLPNVEIRRDGNSRIMHHKVFILDQKTVIFGSYNFTGNANDNNDENILIVHDPEFASYFVEEFEFVWSEAKIE